MSTPILQVQFKGRRKFENLGQCLEREATSGEYYARIKLHRGTEPKQFPLSRTRISIPGTTETAARKSLTRLLDQFEIGRADNPFANRTSKLTIADLAQQYVERACPKRDGRPREGMQLRMAKRRVENLLSYFGEFPWDKLSLGDCSDYFRFRSAAPNKRKGITRERLIDLELTELSCLYRWARRNDKKTGVTSNPISHERPVFRDARSVDDCREAQPTHGDELHQLAEFFFLDPVSHAIGWAILFAGTQGQRISEVLKLKTTAQNPNQPGFIDYDKHGRAKRLYQYRSATHKGTYDYVDRKTQPGLPILREAHRAWLQEQYPQSEHYFSSPKFDGQNPISSMSINKAFIRACAYIGRPTAVRRIAFRVNQLRSARDSAGRRKYQDNEVADYVGQKSRGTLIVDVYDDPPGEPITWLPKTRPYGLSVLKLTSETQLEFGL